METIEFHQAESNRGQRLANLAKSSLIRDLRQSTPPIIAPDCVARDGGCLQRQARPTIILHDVYTRPTLLEQGFDVCGGTADEFDRVVKTHAAKFAKIVEEAEIRTNRSRRHRCDAAWVAVNAHNSGHFA